MSKYDEDYYILQRAKDESQYYLTPTKNTMQRHYKFKEQYSKDGPLVFHSSTHKKDVGLGKSRVLKDVLFDGLSILVRDKHIPLLINLLPKGFKFISAVFVDENDQWYENYQMLNIFNTVDCLDPKNSNILNEDEDGHYEVERYSLKDEVLSAIPEDDRRAIKIARLNIPYTIFHKSVVDVFNENEIDGVRFLRLSEFIEGDQYL